MTGAVFANRYYTFNFAIDPVIRGVIQTCFFELVSLLLVRITPHPNFIKYY